MLWSIDTFQNKVSHDHIDIAGSGSELIEVTFFVLKLTADQLLVSKAEQPGLGAPLSGLAISMDDFVV